MMLTMASGIRSSGKPTSIGEAFLSMGTSTPGAPRAPRHHIEESSYRRIIVPETA